MVRSGMSWCDVYLSVAHALLYKHSSQGSEVLLKSSSAYNLNEIFGENVPTDGTARSVLRKRKWECAVSFLRKKGCSG